MKLNLLKPLFIGIILLCLWQLIGVLGDFPHYIFPYPQSVWYQLVAHSELLWQHTQTTLIEIGLGLLLGFIFGLSSALLLSFSPKTSSLLLPVLVISQAIPVFAIAPILVLWLGYGMPSKILMAIIRRAWLFNDPRQCSYAGGFNVRCVADLSRDFTLLIFQHRLATTPFYLARLTLHHTRRQK